MHTILKNHELGRGYSSSRDRESALATLAFYLHGKPDTLGWRGTFRFNEMVPIPHNGRIYPLWALLDFYKLKELEPRIEEEMIPLGLKSEGLPPLEVVVELAS